MSDQILIVDDEKEIADLLDLYLANEGYTIHKCYDGESALKIVETQAMDLAILDVMLPDVDGFTICRKIREHYNYPIIMLTAKVEDIDKIRGLTIGADDYMTKPFSPSELVARVKAHMERYNRLVGSNVAKNDIIEIRGIKIDKTARRVWINGEEKTFTTKEFDLLTYLATHPNHVFSKDELFSAVWGMDSMGEIATVTVHIKKIRKKTENANVKSGYIETVWGSGYRFRVIDSDVSGERESIVDAI